MAVLPVYWALSPQEEEETSLLLPAWKAFPLELPPGLGHCTD